MAGKPLIAGSQAPFPARSGTRAPIVPLRVTFGDKLVPARARAHVHHTDVAVGQQPEWFPDLILMIELHLTGVLERLKPGWEHEI